MRAKLVRWGSPIALSVGALLLLAAVASATPTVVFTPEFSSGAVGGPGSLDATVKIEGTEYGGFPPPTTQLVVRFPSGTTASAGDHTTCSKQILEQTGPLGCQRASRAGPVGEISAVVAFGEERVAEQATLESFFAPGGGLNLFVDGHSPTSLEIIAAATVTSNVISAEFPLVSTVPGAPYASITRLGLPLGETEAEEVASSLTSGVILPGSCPTGKFSWSSAVTFDQEGAEPIRPEITEQAAEAACAERQEPLRDKRAAEALARKHAEEEAVARRKDEEAELVTLRALVKTLEEELHAAVRVEKIRIATHRVFVTIKTSEPGVVTVKGVGLKKAIKTLLPGTRRLTIDLTKAGRDDRRAHKKVKLSISLKVHSRTVSASREIKL